MDREGDRLTEVLERLAGRPVVPAPAPQFRAPQYNGQGDVEYFVSRFEAVSDANDWGHAAALLHLREALKEDAEGCGKAPTVPAVYAALRARFGLSPREARSRLSTLRKEYRTSLQEHAAEVERLISIAYGELPIEYQAGLKVETFCSTLGYMPLQRHLLAVPAHTLEDAVRAGNEFLQIKPGGEKSHASIRQIEDEEEEETLSPTDKMLVGLMQAMQQLAEKVGALQEQPKRTNGRGTSNNQRLCWECGKEGHLRRNCPNQKSPSDQTAQGNGQGPQE